MDSKKTETKKVEKKEEKTKEENKANQEKEKIEANYNSETLEFAEVTKLEPKVAKKIIDMLGEFEPEDKVGIDDFGIVLSNLKYKLRAKIDIVKLLNKASDEEIKAVIGELVSWRNERPRRLESENYSEMEELKNVKGIFNYLDILNVQNNDK